VQLFVSIISKKFYNVLGALFVLLFVFLVIFLPDIRNTADALVTAGDFKLIFPILGGTLVAFFEQSSTLSLILFALAGTLFSVHMICIVETYRRLRRVRLTIGSLLVSILASSVAGIGCIACGALVAYGTISSLSFLGSFVVMPWGGNEFFVISSLFSLLGITVLFRALRSLERAGAK